MAYVKTEWNTGDLITAEKLNNLENGVSTLADAEITAVTVEVSPGHSETPTGSGSIASGTLSLTFTGLQGEQGEKGEKGDTGAQGPKGDTGAAGKDGTSFTKGAAVTHASSSGDVEEAITVLNNLLTSLENAGVINKPS